MTKKKTGPPGLGNQSRKELWGQVEEWRAKAQLLEAEKGGNAGVDRQLYPGKVAEDYQANEDVETYNTAHLQSTIRDACSTATVKKGVVLPAQLAATLNTIGPLQIAGKQMLRADQTGTVQQLYRDEGCRVARGRIQEQLLKFTGGVVVQLAGCPATVKDPDSLEAIRRHVTGLYTVVYAMMMMAGDPKSEIDAVAAYNLGVSFVDCPHQASHAKVLRGVPGVVKTAVAVTPRVPVPAVTPGVPAVVVGASVGKGGCYWCQDPTHTKAACPVKAAGGKKRRRGK